MELYSDLFSVAQVLKSLKPMRSYLVSITFFFQIFFISFLASAQQFPTVQIQKFIQLEGQNDYKPTTSVDPDYQPGKSLIYKLQYLEIPTSELNITDYAAGPANARQQLLIKKGNKNYFRFFIHPQSVDLYKPLIDRYGWAGFYWASATSSTRSVIAWNPDQLQPPLYLKLSLAQYQDGMGRLIADWEVRRSVGISSMITKTDEATWKMHGSSIIPEFLGATVKKEEGLSFFVDNNQQNVFEHGLIAREADFLNEDPHVQIMPLFGLFTKRSGHPPLIISLWKKSGNPDFYDFADQFLFKSFLKMNSYLLFHQGVVPEIHGQNIVITYDPEKGEILHYYHRDVGSMNVDLRLRYIHGLDISDLRSANAAFDFKFERATEKYESVHMDYFNDWLFRWSYLNTIKEYIPDFSPERTKRKLRQRLLETVRFELPLKSKVTVSSVEEHMKIYYSENPPANWKPLNLKPDAKKLQDFFNQQQEKKQFMQVPDSWLSQAPLDENGILMTEYGVLRREKNQSLRIYYYPSKDLQTLLGTPEEKLASVRKAQVRRTSSAIRCELLFH